MIKWLRYGRKRLMPYETKPSKKGEKKKYQVVKDFEAGIFTLDLFPDDYVYDLTVSWPLYLEHADLTCLARGKGKTIQWWSPFLLNKVFDGLRYWDILAFCPEKEKKISNFLDRIQIEIIQQYDDTSLKNHILDNKGYQYLRKKYPSQENKAQAVK